MRAFRQLFLCAVFGLTPNLIAATSAGATTGTPCNEQCARYVTASLELQWFAGVAHSVPILSCIRYAESRDDYGITNSAGASGAYQFLQGTWDSTALHAGWPWLVGRLPASLDVETQDFMALHLMNWQGLAPWRGDPCVGW